MKNARLTLVCFGIAIFSCAARPQALSSLSIEQRENISSKYAMCSAYFNVVRAGMNKSGYSEFANINRDLAHSTMKQSYEFASKNRTPQMTQRVVESRYGIYQKAMLEEIDNNFSNVSILLNKYGPECALAASNQREFIRKYLESSK